MPDESSIESPRSSVCRRQGWRPNRRAPGHPSEVLHTRTWALGMGAEGRAGCSGKP